MRKTAFLLIIILLASCGSKLTEKVVETLTEHLKQSKSAVLIGYKGLKVTETEELRNKLREKKVDFHVTKNTLFKIALSNTGIKVAPELLDKPLAIAFATEDEVTPAKEIDLFAKEHEALEVLGGILENEYIDEKAIKQLASLPSKEELYAKVVGSLAAPLSGMVNVLVGNIRGLVNVLSQYKEKIS